MIMSVPTLLFAIIVVASRAGVTLGQQRCLFTQQCPAGNNCAFDWSRATSFCLSQSEGSENAKCMFDKYCNAGFPLLVCQTTCKTYETINRDSCLSETKTIMVAIKDSYQTTRVTTRNAKVGDTLMVLDDFSTNSANNRAYKYACTDKGAKYVELHYTATCETPAVGGSTKKKATLFVSGQPRCYAPVSCYKGGKSFDQDLLNSFTIRPTEERADLESHSTEKWTCSGTFRTPTTNLCHDMTASATKSRGMEIATLDMKPVLQVQKSLGLVKEEKLLMFEGTDPPRFTKACELGGGAGYEADGRLVCGKSKFDVKKYPTCLWPLCGGVGTDESRTIIENQLHDHLVKIGNIQNKTACQFSSAFRLFGGSFSSAFEAMLFALVGSILI